jgi:PIN domain nuclease of toxin-antitoxin system
LARDALLVSAISFWEIAMLVAKKRLVLELEPGEFRHAALSLGIREVAVSGDLGIAAARLTRFHGDPGDRIILATSLATNAALVTADRAMLRWRGPGRRMSARR